MWDGVCSCLCIVRYSNECDRRGETRRRNFKEHQAGAQPASADRNMNLLAFVSV